MEIEREISADVVKCFLIQHTGNFVFMAYFIPLFHTGHESPESPRIDFFFLFGGIREVSLYFFLQS